MVPAGKSALLFWASVYLLGCSTTAGFSIRSYAVEAILYRRRDHILLGWYRTAEIDQHPLAICVLKNPKVAFASRICKGSSSIFSYSPQ